MRLKLKNKGYTLVEVMVAMLIATVLLLSVVRIFSRIGETFELNAEAVQLMETTRVALRFVKSDLIQAGYMGCLKTDVKNDTLLETSLVPAMNAQFSSPKGIWGVDGGGSSPDSVSMFYQQDLDIRVLLRDIPGVVTGNPSIIVDAVNVFDDAGDPVINEGDWLTLSNCVEGTAFILTNTPAELDELTLQIIDDASSAYGKVSALEFSTGITYNGFLNETTDPIIHKSYGFSAWEGGAATVNRMVSVTYLVGPSIIDGGDTNSLYRIENGESPSKSNEIVRLVEDFQVTYGIDNDEDGVVDTFVDSFDETTQKAVVVRLVMESSDGKRTETLENSIKLRNKGL